MHPKKVIAERAHKWEPRGKRMNRASRRRQEKNINTYCHTRWSPFSPLDRHYPSIAATSNLAPFSSLSLLTGREGRCSCDTHRDGGWYTKLYKMVTRHSRSNSFFPPFSPQRMHRIYFTITLRKLLSNTHFDDIRTQVTRFFPCSNLTEKNHVVTRSTSTITENIDTCDLFIHVKSRENRYWSRTDACVPIVTLCCTEKRKNCRLQHWRADEISCTDRCDTRYASHIQLSRAADSGRLSVEKVLRLAYAIAALLAADTWPIASRVFGRSLCAPIP